MESRAERIRTLLNQRSVIDGELGQIQAEVTAEQEALKSLRTPRKSRESRQPQLALVGETK
jgi:hypothetical protein